MQRREMKMTEEIMEVWSGEILKNLQRATDIFEVEISCPFDTKRFSPGQFVSIAPLAQESVMSRPFSISSVHDSSFSILIKTIGKNTDLLSEMQKEQIKVWGPCGKGNPITDLRFDELWLIGGGIGIAPLVFFNKVFSDYEKECRSGRGRVRVFYGSQSEEDLDFNLFPADSVEYSTDDGTFGSPGKITELFIKEIEMIRSKKITVVTCGPNIMMRQIARICKHRDVPCFVILEQPMACGTGICLGCSVKMKSGMKRICKDGPVFPAEEVIWDELT
ncbi:MAG: hypothetical protein GF365_05625 [Candidatus Buchananbacteria bacterium]|nr:hypothetical protein [Candidatus Buchananbacteria bacterium]